jgi:hypothetical protein
MSATTTDAAAGPDLVHESARSPRYLEPLLMLVPVGFLVVLGFTHRWVEEDAFLNFRIVDQIRAGHGPVFNIGQRVEATEDPMTAGRFCSNLTGAVGRTRLVVPRDPVAARLKFCGPEATITH